MSAEAPQSLWWLASPPCGVLKLPVLILFRPPLLECCGDKRVINQIIRLFLEDKLTVDKEVKSYVHGKCLVLQVWHAIRNLALLVSHIFVIMS